MGKNFFIYLAVIVGSLAIAVDFASVDLALPALEAQFGFNLDGVQWVINGYVLAFSVFMVAGGRMADAYGRRRVFLLGVGIFAVASLLGGAAWSGGSVIAFRVLQGVGAAMLWPAMIGMACGAVGDKNQAFALGLIFGSCSLGNAAGPVVGGALTEWFSWRWVLWINVPMAMLPMLVALLRVPDDRPDGVKPRNDYAGTAALIGGLVALMLVVYQGGGWGWTDAKTLSFLLAAVALLGAFPFIERRAPEPLIPLEIMRNREIRVLCLAVIAICQMFFVVLLYFTQYAMKFLDEEPVAAGARVVPFMLSYGLVSYFGGPLVARFGTRRLLIGGMLGAIVAAAGLALNGPAGSPLVLNLGLVLLGIGVGAVIPTVSSRAIETVGTGRASLVSGITFMCQLAGSAVMLAINTAVFTAVSAGLVQKLARQDGLVLSEAQRATVNAILVGAKNAPLPGRSVNEAPDLANILDQAYRAGLQGVLWLSAALAAVALLLMLRNVPGRAGENN